MGETESERREEGGEEDMWKYDWLGVEGHSWRVEGFIRKTLGP